MCAGCGQGVGERLCVGCVQGLADRLAELPSLYLACESVLVGRPARSWEPRVSGARPTGLDIDEDAMNARSEMLHVLACWAGLVVDERGVGAPRREIAALTDFLTLHLDWLVSGPTAGDLAAELTSVADAARMAARRGRVEPLDVGPCDQPDCTRTVRVLFQADQTCGRPDVRCDGGHVWEPRQWLALGQRISRERERQERVA